MADSLRDDFQVPVSWVEDASDDTWENAAFSAEILKKRGIHSVYVVTQGWHMRRAMLAFRHAGPDRHGGADVARHAVRSDRVGFPAARVGLAMELLRAA